MNGLPRTRAMAHDPRLSNCSRRSDGRRSRPLPMIPGNATHATALSVRASGPKPGRRMQGGAALVGGIPDLLISYFPKIARIAARPRLVMRGSL
jgi:hypothetical protein